MAKLIKSHTFALPKERNKYNHKKNYNKVVNIFFLVPFMKKIISWAYRKIGILKKHPKKKKQKVDHLQKHTWFNFSHYRNATGTPRDKT